MFKELNSRAIALSLLSRIDFLKMTMRSLNFKEISIQASLLAKKLLVNCFLALDQQERSRAVYEVFKQAVEEKPEKELLTKMQMTIEEL